MADSYGDLAGLVTFRPLERAIPSQWRRSPFRASWSVTVSQLAREIRMLKPRGPVVMQVDLREDDFRLDGLPRADRRAMSPGVVLAFESAKVGHALRYAVATFDDWRDNVRAIALGLDALRAVDRYGITGSAEQYAGWKALPSGGPSADRGREIIREHGSVRDALMATHPDHGGEAEDFVDVQAARQAGAV